jgi:NAD(P)-dependent dehydrogenase (short-subunit alcohol dehydrogenase family)
MKQFLIDVASSGIGKCLAKSQAGFENKVFCTYPDHPLKRIGTAADVASLVEFLLSQRSSRVTCQVLHIDGGIIT